MQRSMYSSTETANDTITTTTETVVCTLSGINTPRKTSVHVRGWAQITTGATVTALTPRIRRGTDATGTLVGEGAALEVAAAAGSDEEIHVEAEDAGVDLANGTYVMTVQQAGATGNGTCLQASMEANHER